MMHYLVQQHRFDYVDLDHNYSNWLERRKKQHSFELEILFFLPKYGLSGIELSNVLVRLSDVCDNQGTAPGPAAILLLGLTLIYGPNPP